MIFRALKGFFAFLWTALGFLRAAVANIMFLIFVFIVVVALGSSTEHILPEKAVLVLDPSGVLVEELAVPETTDALWRNLGGRGTPATETKVQDIIDAVRQAAQDPHIQALVLEPSDLQGCDTTKIMDIGQAIREFKKSGKPVLAYSTMYSQGQYLLASYADLLSVNPLGGVLLTGFGMYPTYFKGLLEKTRINFHIFRVGDYKSAVEPFLRDSMSTQAKESGRKWLQGLWSAYVHEVGQNRDLAPQEIDAYAQHIDTRLTEVHGDAASLAAQARLVDAVHSSDQFEDLLAEKTGQTNDEIQRLNFRDYLQSRTSQKSTGETIAIIRARGPILPGKQPESMIGSQSVAALFEQARQNPDIAAVVLRLDSPGGSATASEEIHREIVRTQAAGKPVVVSMGSLAASGAYWIATAATRILAAPTTLTGSIGIFAAFPTFEDTSQTLGITTDGIGTAPLADLGNPLRPLSDRATQAILRLLEFGYASFRERVAAGREMSIDEVENSAQGQVFLGDDALHRKLVDQTGNLDDALRVAAELAGMTEIRTQELRRELSTHEKLLHSLLSSGTTWAVSRFPEVAKALELVKGQTLGLDLRDPGHIYALSLECSAAKF